MFLTHTFHAFFPIVFSLLISCLVSATEQKSVEQKVTGLKITRQKLTLISVNEPPANFINEQGTAAGYVVDIVNAIQKNLGLQNTIYFLPETRALRIAASQPNTIFFSTSRLPSREHKLDWIGLVLKKSWHVYTKADNNLILEQLSDLKHLPSLGVVHGDIREEWLLEQGFTNVHAVTYPEQNIRQLFSNRVAGIVFEEHGLRYLCQYLGLDQTLIKKSYTLKQSDVYITISKHSGINTTQWKKAYQAIKNNGTLLAISKHWQKKLMTEYKITSEVSDDILVF